MVTYVCTMANGWHYSEYDPVCVFPYINKGWMNDGEPGFDDVVFNDCSITLSQAMGPGYNYKVSAVVVPPCCFG